MRNCLYSSTVFPASVVFHSFDRRKDCLAERQVFYILNPKCEPYEAS